MAYKNKLYYGLIAIITAMMLVGCHDNTDSDFTVTGELKNIDDGYQILFFKSHLDGSTSTIAIDTLVNGRFDFTAPAETGVLYHIASPQYEKFSSMCLDFYVEQGAEISIIGNDFFMRFPFLCASPA